MTDAVGDKDGERPARELAAVGQETSALLAQLADIDLDRCFSGGRATLRGVLRAMIEHEQEHLQQLFSTRRRVAARRTEIGALEAEAAAAHATLIASLVRVPSHKLDVAPEASWSIRQIVEHLMPMEKGWQEGIAHLIASRGEKTGGSA